MKNFFKFDFGLKLKRIFGKEKKTEQREIFANSDNPLRKQFADFAEIEAPVMLTIWTIERNRYTTPVALSTEVEVYPSGAVILCEDIASYVLDTPNGETVVVEARTGGLVGHSIEIVIDGIREMTKTQLNNQLDTAKKEFNRMKKQAMSNEEFWKAIKMGGSEVDVSQDFQE